jgi:hypothetical protein
VAAARVPRANSHQRNNPLKDMGYERIYNLGGFKDQAESGGAVEK